MSRFLGRIAAAVGLAGLGAGLTACGPAPQDFVTPGVLTIATGSPAYYPWVVDDDPTTGEGFEAAVAYAVAAQLGFTAENILWVRIDFDDVLAPGPKDFDIAIQQISITAERRRAVDFSSPYYETAQAVVTTTDSPAAGAATLADLAEHELGAVEGTTSFDAIEQVIRPDSGARGFADDDAVKQALEEGEVDAIVVDLPTAFALVGVELRNGVVVGQLPAPDGERGDELAFVLPKGSRLTDDVTDAVDTIRDDGTLDALAEEWLADSSAAPLLE